ncbi:MAG: endonuclease [Paludibacteraceae bacterium]
MKHTTKLLTLFGALLISTSAWAVNATYYTSLDGKSGSDLRVELTNITTSKHTTEMGYDWTFDNIDIIGNTLLDIYSTCSWTITTDQCGSSYAQVCDCYNREHIVPQSLFNEVMPQKGDRHHLFLTDGKVNNQRSSYPFGECSSGTSAGTNALGKLGTSTFTGYTSVGTVFEPDDQYKGDIARAIMYMAIRYATVSNYPVTSWSSNAMFSSSLTPYYGLSDYAVAVLLKWHRQDPVSQKEIDRNNGIETAQGNRNPFIDYPCLAEYLWGDKAGETFSTASCCGSFEAKFSVGSDGCTACATTSDPSAPTITISQSAVNCESVYVGNTGSNTFTVSGSNLTADITLSITGDGFSIDQTTLTQTDGTVAETTITVTFKPTAAGDYSGTITISSDGATTQTVTVKGSGTTGTIGTAPESSKPAIYFGTVVESALTVSGETATLNLHISDLATNVTVASSDENIFTIETSTGNATITPDEAAAGVTITLTKKASGTGTANLTITGGVVDNKYEITFQ